MRLLYFVQYYYPEKAAGLQLVEDMLKGYVDAGFDVDLYIPMPTRGITKEERKEYKKRKIEYKYNNKLTIHRMALYREGKGFIPRTIRYFIFSFECFWKGLTKRADVVFSGSAPPSQGVIIGWIKKLTGKRFVYNLQDIFPDSLVNVNMTHKGSIIWKIGRKMENYTYRKADRIIVISEDFKNNILEKGVPEDKIVVVPNWVNSTIRSIPREENVLINRYDLDPSKFIICYSGNIGYTQNIELLVDVAEGLKATDINFVIIGDGSTKEELERMITDRNLTNMKLLPYQPYEELSHVFSLGDAGLVISRAGIGGNSIPSKTWDIMAAERPVLASFDADSDLSKIIQKEECGIAVPADNKEELIGAILKLYNDERLRKQYGQNGKRYLVENLDRDKCVGEYIKTTIQAIENAG